MTPDWVRKLESEPCTCESCPECRGTGNVYWLLGHYEGPYHPCDDLADPQPCECCENGVLSLCDRCAELEAYYSQETHSPRPKPERM